MKQFFKEFVQFASRGNLMSIVVALILGVAFSRIVSSLVSDILLPPIYALFNMPDLNELQYVVQRDPEVAIRYGRLLSTLLDFVIVVFCLFLALRCAMRWQSKAAAPVSSGKAELLAQIRNTLKKERQSGGDHTATPDQPEK